MADKKVPKKNKNTKNSQTSRSNTSKSNSSKKSSSKKSKKSKKIFKWTILSIVFAFLAIAVIGVGYIVAVVKNTPPIDINQVVNVDQTLAAYDDNDKFIASLHGKEDYQKVTSEEIPKNLKNAIVAIEDERFYEHNGVDVKRILGALANDAVYFVTRKGGLQGASTLTQQLVKNTILTNKQTAERKISEIYLALELEKMLSKDEILTAYLNHFPVGGIAYGAKAGASMYFSKDVSDLNLIECAYLAGVTQAPTAYSAYNPNNEKDPTPYIKRTKTVLSKMLEHNYITKAEYDKAIKDLDNGKLKFKRTKTDYRLPYEDFIYATVDQVKKDLKSKYKYSDEQVENLVSTGGLKVYTTMDRKIQDSTQKILNNYSNFNIPGTDKVNESGIPLLQASATVTDYKTGKVLALVGGRGDQDAQSLNRAYSSLRPTGSSSKPLTVYGPAIDSQKLTAASVIDDAPIPKSVSSYNPTNSPNQYYGLTTLRESLKRSSNVGATLTLLETGSDTALSYGQKFGLKYTEDDIKKKEPSVLALGQFPNDPKDPDGGNTYLMSSAIGTFGNGGVYVKPRLYTKVVDNNGNVILDNEIQEEKILSKQAAYIVYDMLKGPIQYNAQRAQFGSMPVAGKTGTTSYNKDYWFAGLTPNLSAAVWVGYDKNNSIKGGGSGTTASNLWGKIMKVANEGLSTKDIEKPDGIVEVAVCKDSGKLPTDLCKNDPRGNRIYTEMFIEGTEPKQSCETHVSASVNTLNGKLANSNTPSGLVAQKIFIKKLYPNSKTEDYKYVLPSSSDDMTSMPNTNTNDDKKKEDDKNKKEDEVNTDNNQNNNENNQTDTTPSILDRLIG
ncbi:penicillin-binding protein 1A [Clostridium baratii]|uniref:transglycosylase domain-containing protein n=1 Tax=Clostridium baratii TaxID=1561 RepID=UPI0006C613E6|nr:transglycosylase domain-containing protein [Clostridium baratii]CUO93185.1 penicillin-binding protein 1A [Clostridium baratii]